MGSGVVVLVSNLGDVNLITMVTKDVLDKNTLWKDN